MRARIGRTRGSAKWGYDEEDEMDAHAATRPVGPGQRGISASQGQHQTSCGTVLIEQPDGGPECSLDSDCPSGQVCQGGQCVPVNGGGNGNGNGNGNGGNGGGGGGMGIILPLALAGGLAFAFSRRGDDE